MTHVEEGAMFRGRVGRGCSICETRAVALANLLPRPFLAYTDSDVLSWTAEPPVLALHGVVNLRTQQFPSEQPLGQGILIVSARVYLPQCRQLRSIRNLALRVIDSQRRLRASLVDFGTWGEKPTAIT